MESANPQEAPLSPLADCTCRIWLAVSYRLDADRWRLEKVNKIRNLDRSYAAQLVAWRFSALLGILSLERLLMDFWPPTDFIELPFG